MNDGNESQVKNYKNLIEGYHQLAIGDEETNIEHVWQKKLRNILNTDIHEKVLGCHIRNTHIRIGNLHYGSFYEAQLLFSHARWVGRFSEWLKNVIKTETCKKNILIVGYETYIEPVLIKLEDNKKNIHYCIYEEAKYESKERIRYFDHVWDNCYKKGLKYQQIIFVCGISTSLSIYKKMYDLVESKIRKIENESKRNIKISVGTNMIQDSPDDQTMSILSLYNPTFYSVVQVLPESVKEGDHYFPLDDSTGISWDKAHKSAARVFASNDLRPELIINVKYLIDVFSEIYLAKECPWCFPSNGIENERPLIKTEDVSVIPTQMIGRGSAANKEKSQEAYRNKYKDNNSGDSEKNNCVFSNHYSLFFKKETVDVASEAKTLSVENTAQKEQVSQRYEEKFVFQDCLYYKHIVRSDHHYHYYIRTGALLIELLEKTPKIFEQFCKQTKKDLDLPNDNTNNINIIIAPLHFSNSRFPHEINTRVFDGKAHEITFDPRKEYRSNFEVKYSNYGYALEQIKGANSKTQICFYFVDDEINTGYTFNRSKSFAKSLMKSFADRIGENGEEEGTDKKDEYSIYSGIITLIDRTSVSTKYNYIDNTKKFCSCIHFPVPSIRNYGDSCPLCRQIQDAEVVFSSCTLNGTAQYWEERQRYLQVGSIDRMHEHVENKITNPYQKRHFIRFHCECLLWDAFLGIWEKEEMIAAFYNIIGNTIRTMESADQYEYLISFLKVASRPFLYYRENEKKAIMEILHKVISSILANKDIKSQIVPIHLIGELSGVKYSKRQYKELEENAYKDKICSLLIVIISCLSCIESNYLLSIDRIKAICDYIKALDPSMLRFNKTNYTRENKQGIYTIIVNNFKRVISGTSGFEKSQTIDADLRKSMFLINDKSNSFVDANDYQELFRVLYIENIQQSKKILNNSFVNKRKWEETNGTDVIKKYAMICDDDWYREKNNDLELPIPELCFYKQIPGKSSKEEKETEETIIIPDALIDMCNNMNLEKTQDILLGEEIDEKLFKEQRTIAQDKLQRTGLYEYKNKIFWVVFQYTDGANNTNEIQWNNPKNVFLRIRFKESHEDNYKALRRILIYRKMLSEIICADIRTGALDSAVQAKAAQILLESNKAQSHGSYYDLRRLLKIANNKFMEYKGTSQQNKRQKKALHIEALVTLNLFMNICISRGATCEVIDLFFPALKDTIITPFYAENDYVDTTQGNGEIEDVINNYINLLNSIEYQTDIMDAVYMKNNINAQEKDIRKRKIIWKNNLKPKAIKQVPLLMEIPQDNVQKKTPQDDMLKYLYLIGILDVLVRNAFEHSDENDEITITYVSGARVVDNKYKNSNEQATYNKSYKFTVSNNMRSLTDWNRKGMTKRFLVNHLNKKRPKDNNFFYITMEKVQKGNKSVFESSLVVVVKEFLENKEKEEVR